MERKTISRAFAEKHLPLIYKISLERLGDAALAKVACKRVFTKVQEAMDANVMPAETVLAAWLTFLSEDIASDMLKQMPFTAATAPQPERKADQATLRPPAAATKAERSSSQTAQPETHIDPPRTKPVQEESIHVLPLVASSAPVPAEPASGHAASTAGVATDSKAAIDTNQPRARKRNVERDTEVHFSQRKRPFRILIMILFGIFILINLWFIVGLLCSRGILPKLDLGYTWFDTFVYELFKL